MTRSSFAWQVAIGGYTVIDENTGDAPLSSTGSFHNDTHSNTLVDTQHRHIDPHTTHETPHPHGQHYAPHQHNDEGYALSDEGFTMGYDDAPEDRAAETWSDEDLWAGDDSWQQDDQDWGDDAGHLFGSDDHPEEHEDTATPTAHEALTRLAQKTHKRETARMRRPKQWR